MSVYRYFALAAMSLLPAQFAKAVDGPVAPAAHFDYYNGCSDGSCASGCDTGCSSCSTGCSTCACDPCCCGGGGCGGLLAGLTIQNILLGEDNPLKVAGWTQSGYHNKATNTLSPQTSASFNNRPGVGNLHQAWLYAEKAADGSAGLDWGFRADVVYGIDGADTQAFGNPVGSWDFANGFDHGAYSWALPQMYVELAQGDLSVKMGHFFTPVGYEVVPATGNFFYSHAFTQYNSEPFTHTGVLGTFKYNDFVTLYGGWTLGWDTGFDQFQGGNSFLGGAALDLDEDVTLTYITTFGDLGWRGDDGYSHSLVLQVNLAEALQYVLQSDFVDANGGASALTGPALNNHSVGVNQYLFYTINDMLKVGGRAEWWKGDGDSHYAMTAGVNITPMALTTIRPEIRHQWSPAFGTDETIFGIDWIRQF